MDRIKAVEVFVSIVERGSLAGAAQALGMSRPMVTRYLTEMENWARSRLLNRSTRRISLTPAGEHILEQCKHMQQISSTIEQGADCVATRPRGSVRIACVQSIADQLLTPALARYMEQHPLVSVELVISNAVPNMVEDRIDLAIRVTNDLEPSMIARRLGVCKLRMVASPDFLEKNGKPRKLDQLKQLNCLSGSLCSKTCWSFHEGASISSVQVGGSFSSNDIRCTLMATLKSGGIALLPELMVKDLLADGRLCEVLPEFRPVDQGIHGVYISRAHMSATLRTLLDFLVNWFGTCPVVPVPLKARQHESGMSVFSMARPPS